MTFDEYHNLMDKYGIEVAGDLLYLYYRNYLLGRIEIDETYQDQNRHVCKLFNERKISKI